VVIEDLLYSVGPDVVSVRRLDQPYDELAEVVLQHDSMQRDIPLPAVDVPIVDAPIIEAEIILVLNALGEPPVAHVDAGEPLIPTKIPKQFATTIPGVFPPRTNGPTEATLPAGFAVGLALMGLENDAYRLDAIEGATAPAAEEAPMLLKAGGRVATEVLPRAAAAGGSATPTTLPGEASGKKFTASTVVASRPELAWQWAADRALTLWNEEL
jgi:hypothetical protein